MCDIKKFDLREWPLRGFAMIVDGHFKTEFDTVDAAEASGRELKSAHPMLSIEIYDANTRHARC
jgi:hypothetical protein